MRVVLDTMNTKNMFSEESQSIAYGNAYTVFGNEAIEAVIHNKKWMKKYPDVINSINSSESKRYATILPAEMVYEIAGREECEFDFYTPPDGQTLHARDRHKKWDIPRTIDVLIETQGFRQIPNQQALLEYGVYCLYRAVDVGWAKKGYTGR
jgi:hypothetical protein